MKLPKNVSIEDVMEAAQSDNSEGFCLSCGNQQSGCEPDARDYECDKCGENKVYGAQEILIMVV